LVLFYITVDWSENESTICVTQRKSSKTLEEIGRGYKIAWSNSKRLNLLIEKNQKWNLYFKIITEKFILKVIRLLNLVLYSKYRVEFLTNFIYPFNCLSKPTIFFSDFWFYRQDSNDIKLMQNPFQAVTVKSWKNF